MCRRRLPKGRVEACGVRRVDLKERVFEFVCFVGETCVFLKTGKKVLIERETLKVLEGGTVGEREGRRRRDSELVGRAEPSVRMRNDEAHRAQS